MRQHPFAVVQLGVSLLYLHALHEVHSRLGRQRQMAALHVERGVLHNPQFAGESEVLLVVGQELQMETRVALHLHRVYDIVAVELYGVFSYRTGEACLQQSYLVVVDVHVAEHVFHHCAHHLAGLYELVHAVHVLSHDDCLFRMRVLAVYLPRDGLVNHYRHYQLVVVWASLHLVHHPVGLLRALPFQFLRRDVVHRQCQLLVFGILEEVVIFYVGALLGCYHPSHQCHGRVFLSLVSLAL